MRAIRILASQRLVEGLFWQSDRWRHRETGAAHSLRANRDEQCFDGCDVRVEVREATLYEVRARKPVETVHIRDYMGPDRGQALAYAKEGQAPQGI